MAGRNLIVASNPARRKRKQSAKQRAASLRNLRKARRARGSRKVRARRRNPSTSSNPRRRRSPRRVMARRRRPTRRVYRNPARRLVPRDLIGRTVMPALVGGAGAVANDVAYSFLLGKLPMGTGAMGDIVMQLQSGPLRHAGKLVSALALAYVASFVVNRRTSDQLGAGAVTVIGYNVVRDIMAKVAPDLTLGAYLDASNLGWAGPGQIASGQLDPRGRATGMSAGLARYLSPRLRGLPGLTTRGQLSQTGMIGHGAPKSAADSYAADTY